MFAKHHYLTGDLSRSAKCYVAMVDGKEAAFTSVIHFPHPSSPKFKKFHRTVVLPDYQGIGVAQKLRSVVSRKMKNDGWRVLSVTSHPAMITVMKKDPQWICKRKGRLAKQGRTSNTSHGATNSNSRITTSWEHIG